MQHQVGLGVCSGQLTDAEVIEGSLRAPGCFGIIFDRHGGEILRYVYARLGPGAAEDAAAETFLAAFRCRARYDPARGEVRPWLYGIATRVIGKHRREERRQQSALQRQAMTAAQVVDDVADRCAERADAGQFRSRVMTAVSDLPRQDRDLLLLIAWADLTYSEAALALGIPVGTVRSRLSRIRVKTRAALGGTNPLRHEQEDDHG